MDFFHLPQFQTPNIPGLTITVAKLAVVQMYGESKSKEE